MSPGVSLISVVANHSASLHIPLPRDERVGMEAGWGNWVQVGGFVDKYVQIEEKRRKQISGSGVNEELDTHVAVVICSLVTLCNLEKFFPCIIIVLWYAFRLLIVIIIIFFFRYNGEVHYPIPGFVPLLNAITNLIALLQ